MCTQTYAWVQCGRYTFKVIAIWFWLMVAGCQPHKTDGYTGYVEAELVYVSAPITGVIQQIAVSRGGSVKEGEKLFVLEAQPERLQRAEAQARLAQAQAQVANLSKARRPQEIEAVAEQLAQAIAALAASKAALERHQTLVAKGFESASRLDDLQSARTRDQARVNELQAQLALAKSPARADEIAAAQAHVQAAKAALEASAWRESQSVQYAPVDAVVFDVAYRLGERVSVNTPVVSLLPLSKTDTQAAVTGGLVLRFYVPQADLPKIALGQSVRIDCDGCSGVLGGTVTFISPQAEYTPPVIYSNESRSKLVFMVRAQPDTQTAGVLKPGQPIDVHLVAAHAQ